MDRSYLNVNAPYVDEAPIKETFLHSFLPFSSTALNQGDEVRIAIQNKDALTLPCESFILLLHYWREVDETHRYVIERGVYSEWIGQIV